MELERGGITLLDNTFADLEECPALIDANIQGDPDSNVVKIVQQVALYWRYSLNTKRHQDCPINKKARIQWGSNR